MTRLVIAGTLLIICVNSVARDLIPHEGSAALNPANLREPIAVWQCKDPYSNGKDGAALLEFGHYFLKEWEEREVSSNLIDRVMKKVMAEGKQKYGPAPALTRTGFFLLAGDKTTTRAHYFRDGLDHRWNWLGADVRFKYSFIITPDGTGLYYDFSSSRAESVRPSSRYQCSKGVW